MRCFFAGFHEGSAQFDNVAGSESSGTLPDGVFDDNTKLFFCCRKDASYVSPVSLPINQEFMLLKNEESCAYKCQSVEGWIPLKLPLDFSTVITRNYTAGVLLFIQHRRGRNCKV